MATYKPLDAHLFICTNVKDGVECCGAKGSAALRDAVKDIARGKWGARLRVNAAGCLGRCEDGIAAVLYPQNVWKMGLAPDSAPELIKLLEETLEPSK